VPVAAHSSLLARVRHQHRTAADRRAAAAWPAARTSAAAIAPVVAAAAAVALAFAQAAVAVAALLAAVAETAAVGVRQTADSTVRQAPRLA